MEKERERKGEGGVCEVEREGGRGGQRRQGSRRGKGKGEEEGPKRRGVDKRSQEEREWVKEERTVGGEEGAVSSATRREGEGMGDEGGVKGEGRGAEKGEDGWWGEVCFPADDVNVGDGVF